MEQNQSAFLSIDPSTYTLQTYLALVRELDSATSTKFDHETYKQADLLLTQFSKTHQAWSVTIQVLTLENLNDKNLQLVILKKMTSEGKPPFLINCLCTAIAILIMHINENWPDMIDQLIMELSNTVEQATCLLMILKYMASDCDNDSIVIEDSLRNSYFKYLDTIAAQIFDQIFNLWAQKINQQVINVQSTEDYKLQKLKSKLVEAFYNWIKLKLPDEVITNMTQLYPDLLKLVFSELENKDENLENATNCVIELIILSRKNPEKFGSIKDAVIEKVTHLIARVDQAVQERDETLGEQLIDIFVELGQTHINQIIETGAATIPEILLKLMTIPEIRNRRQVSFWKQLFKGIIKIQPDELKTQKLMQFEPILLKLLDQIVEQMRAEDDMFEDFNYVSEFDEQFDDFNLQVDINNDYRLRNDFGKLIQVICKCCGPQAVYAVFLEKLKKHVLQAQQGELKIQEWSSIECLITCISDLAQTLTINEVGTLNDIIQLIYQLPTDYVALRRAGANLFASLSKIIKQHGMNAQQDVKKFVDYVIQGLNNKYSTPACSKAFQKLCIDNAQTLAPFTAELIEKSNIPIIYKILAIPFPATEWTTKEHYLLILDGISALIEKYEDKEGCEQCMKKVIESFAIPLMEKINNLKSIFIKEGKPLMQKDINEGVITTISGYLLLIGDFLKGCKGLGEREVNPFEGIFSELWNLFIQQNFQMFTHIDEIVEQTVRLMKHCLRILGRRFDNYLIPFLQLSIKAYEQNPIPGFIYSIEFCLVEYHKVRDYEQIFLESFNMLSARTAQVLTSLTEYENFPDIAFDFFGMVVRYLRLNKDLVFRSDQLETVISIWIKGIGIEHKEAITTHTEFITYLIATLQKDVAGIQDLTNQQEIQKSGINPNEIIVWDYFLTNGMSIVDKYILVILSAPQKSIVDKFVDVLVEIAMRFPIPYKQLWFTSAFTKIPGDVLTEEEKQRHITKIIQQNPKMDSLVDNFDTIAKRARNTINRGN